MTQKLKCDVPSIVKDGSPFNRNDDFNLAKIDDFAMFDCSKKNSSARCVEISCSTDNELMKKNDILNLVLEGKVFI